MAYVLEALLFTRGSVPSDVTHLVVLPQSLSMQPITEAHLQRMGDEERTRIGGGVLGFSDLSLPIVRFAERASGRGRVCYVHAEYHGGTGFQAAVGWFKGAIEFGPVFTANHETERQTEAYEIVPLADNAINCALRFLGVESDDIDEFASIGLGRHRWTDDW